MALFVDNPRGEGVLLPPEVVGAFAPANPADSDVAQLLHALFGPDASLHSAPVDLAGWRAVLVRDHANGSQYDAVIQLIRSGVALPDGVACLARTGSGMHGFRGRPWSACDGNIHLTVHLAPGCAVERFESAFTVLAAVSALEAVDSVASLRGEAGIKWVNDILVHGFKVGGVLAHTQTRDSVVTAVVLGIGLNVEATPEVERSRFVPAASSLREHAADPASVRVGDVLHALLESLWRNYALLLREGHEPLLDRYRARSAILGESVEICSEDGDATEVVARGRVERIGDGLELYLEGNGTPIVRGRLRYVGRAT
jgi:biotin-[acetyl-CoA-carboxylase] ligase BirA-like protein